MKANELRIGNNVYSFNPNKKGYPNDLLITVNHKHITNCFNYPDSFSPIPLTEEWLIRFGFDVVSNAWNIKEDPLEFRILFLNGVYYFQWGRRIETKIKYVNQLQNLYFALTGNELTYNQNG